MAYLLTFLLLPSWRFLLEILGDSKVTHKFQATIPRAVRDLLGLDSGDRIVFVMEDDHVAVKKGKLEVEA